MNYSDPPLRLSETAFKSLKNKHYFKFYLEYTFYPHCEN